MNDALSLAFYRARRGRLLDRLIAGHDGGPFSHVELVFGRQDLATGYSLCCSSSWRDGGVRMRRLRLEPAAWQVVPLPVPPADAAAVRRWCIERLGGRYDVAGVLAFKLPLVREKLGWWFCSELCAAALQHVGLLPNVRPRRVTPNRLFDLARALAAAPAL